MKIEYRVIKRVYEFPGAPDGLPEWGWFEIRQVYFEGNTPRTGGMDRGVHGSTVDQFLDDFNNYGTAISLPILVMSMHDDRLIREDPPLMDALLRTFNTPEERMNMPADKLYDVARDACHEQGMSWTDPRTGTTYDPPK